MEVIHKLNFDLLHRGVPEVIHAVQGDTHTRIIEAALYAGGQPFEPPAGTVAAVRFRTAANTGGTYDTLQDGSSAYTINGNTVRVTLDKAVLSAPGNCNLQIALISGSDIISTFSCIVAVHADPSIGTAKPEDYTNLSNLVLAEIDAAAKSGKFRGDPGPPGPAPIKGVDYWTAEDQQAFKDDLRDGIAAEVKTYVDEYILGGAW